MTETELFVVSIETAENLSVIKTIEAIDEADAARRVYLEIGGRHVENMEDITDVEDITKYLTEASTFPFILLSLPTFEVLDECTIKVIRVNWYLHIRLWQTNLN